MNAEMLRRATCISKFGLQLWHMANAEMVEENAYMEYGLLSFDERRHSTNVFWMFNNGLLTAEAAYAMIR